MKSKDPKQNKEYPKDYTKKQQLKRLREIEKDGCGKEFKSPMPKEKWDKCGDILDGELLLCPKCEKEARHSSQP